MSNPTAISDLERAEHLGYSDSKGVKRVSIFNDGVQANVATSDNQDPLAKYKDAGMDVATDDMYFGYIALDGSWYIKYLNTATGTTFCKGASGYSTAWTGRAGLTYGLFNDIFS